MSVALTYASTLTAVETLETNVPAAQSNLKSVTHSGYNTSASLTGATAVPVTKCAYFEQALSSGSATINLAALAGTNGATVDLTGLKVQAIKFKAKAANANPITLTEGASNGYELAGNGWTVVLKAGQEFVFYGNEQTPDVASGARTIDLSGTGSQSVEVSVVAG